MNVVNLDGGIEAERLGALLDYDILDTPAEASFERITRLAMAVMEAPIAWLSLVDGARAWFKSRQGVDFANVRRDGAFCAQAIRQPRPLVVSDAGVDPRFRDNPLVQGEPGLRFYVGAPLRTPQGHAIGVLCAADRRPRQPTPEQIAAMVDLADLAMAELERRRMAVSDAVTGALTRRAFLKEAQEAFDLGRRYERPFSCIVLDVDRYRPSNDGRAVAVPEPALRLIATTCRGAIRAVDIFGRLSGGRFAIALPETDLARARLVAQRLRRAIALAGEQSGAGRPWTTASIVGVAARDPADARFTNLLERAEAARF
jgi:diguanylate cyclase (GGDEF)-like protein